MNTDYEYAQMLQLMREQCKKDNPETIKLGTMLNPYSVKIDDLILNKEDLWYDYSLRPKNLEAGDKVAVQRLDSGMYLIFAKVVRAE